MQVVIPMSGTGSRFVSKGYKEIKPLIQVFKKPIIEYIVEKFSFEDHFIFICRDEHLSNKDLNLKKYLNSLAPNTTIVGVENHKLGPVYSLLKVEKYLDNNEQLIVNYCDFDWRWDYEEFKHWLLKEKPEAALCVYSGFHPHYINPATYAYTRNHQHNVLEIREKQSFTKYREEENAASGTFYFSSGKLLLEACKWLFKSGEDINGEYYVSLLFNYFPSMGMRTLTYQIDHFMQWGTPQDLVDFLFFANKVPLNFQSNKIDCPLIILMAGKGNRMKTIEKTKKPYLKLDNIPLFKLCNKNFISNKKNICALNGDNEDHEFMSRFDEYKRIAVNQTSSSVETLFSALNQSELPNDEGLLVLPCDAAIDLNWNNFINESKIMKNCEAIIFSFVGYPYARWTPNQYGWLKMNNDNSVNSIGYKSGWDSNFTNPIITGHFYFPSIGKLKVNLKLFIESLKNSDKEISIDEFCGFLITKNQPVLSYQVDDFLCLGTPNEFRTYEYWLNANQISKIN